MSDPQTTSYFESHRSEIEDLARRIDMPISTQPRSDASAPEPKEGEKKKRGPRKGLFGYAFLPSRTVKKATRWYIRISDPAEVEHAAALLLSASSPHVRTRKNDTCVIVSLQMVTPPRGWDPKNRHAAVADPGLVHGHGRTDPDPDPAPMTQPDD